MLKKQQHQNNNIESKPLNVFDYLKSSSQEAKDLMDEIKDAKMTSTMVNYFLFVIIRKDLTLTPLINH